MPNLDSDTRIISDRCTKAEPFKRIRCAEVSVAEVNRFGAVRARGGVDGVALGIIACFSEYNEKVSFAIGRGKRRNFSIRERASVKIGFRILSEGFEVAEQFGDLVSGVLTFESVLPGRDRPVQNFGFIDCGDIDREFRFVKRSDNDTGRDEFIIIFDINNAIQFEVVELRRGAGHSERDTGSLIESTRDADIGSIADNGNQCAIRLMVGQPVFIIDRDLVGVAGHKKVTSPIFYTISEVIFYIKSE